MWCRIPRLDSLKWHKNAACIDYLFMWEGFFFCFGLTFSLPLRIRKLSGLHSSCSANSSFSQQLRLLRICQFLCVCLLPPSRVKDNLQGIYRLSRPSCQCAGMRFGGKCSCSYTQLLKARYIGGIYKLSCFQSRRFTFYTIIIELERV